MAATPATTADSGIVESRLSDAFKTWLMSRAVEEDTNRSYDVMAAQLDRMLTETDLDSIMDADEQGALQGRDLAGFEFTLNPGFRVVKSSDKFKSPLGVYIQITGTALISFPSKGISIGEDVLISTGAPLIIGKVRTLEANGYLPLDVKIIGIDAGEGTVLKLGRATSRSVKG